MRPPFAYVLVCVAALAGSVAVATPAGAATARHQSHQDYPPRPGGTPFVVGVPLGQPKSGASGATSSVSLSPRQVSSATAIVRSDFYVKRLLAGLASAVLTISTWSSPTKQILGAVVRLSFSRPTPVKGQWLALRRKPYVAAYPHVVALRAFVDLHRKQVVALVPTTR